MGSLYVKGQFLVLYLDKLYFKVPAIVRHALWVIGLCGALALVRVWLLSSMDVWTRVVGKYDTVFSWLYLHMLLLKYFHEGLEIPLRNPKHIYRQADTHAHTRTHLHNTHKHTQWITSIASFQTHTGPSVSASLLLYSPSTSVHQFFPRGPWLYPLCFPRSLSMQRKCQDQVWGGQHFFVYSGQLVHSR